LVALLENNLFPVPALSTIICFVEFAIVLLYMVFLEDLALKINPISQAETLLL
jgi:hypothetical protein